MGEKRAGQPAANRNYRDTVFRMLFKEKKELLSLFNAVYGTSYDEPEELEITTLENAVYMAMKNDISCVLDLQQDLYEHQSTVNPNMPLRDLFYVSKLLENRTKDQNLYAQKRIKLPAPKFVVFYNGETQQPERREYRLSESFAKRGGEINLELVVLQLNINPGYNPQIVENCPTLLEYIQYTDRVRRYKMEQPLAEAVERAVDECIEEGILTDFLRKTRVERVHIRRKPVQRLVLSEQVSFNTSTMDNKFDYVKLVFAFICCVTKSSCSHRYAVAFVPCS